MPIELVLNQLEIKKQNGYEPIVAQIVGEISTSTEPSIGDFLVYTSNGWDAVAVSSAQGVSF